MGYRGALAVACERVERRLNATKLLRGKSMRPTSAFAMAAGLGLFGLTAPLLADPAITDPPAPAAATSDDDKVVRPTRHAIGSRIEVARDFHTLREWNEITRVARDYTNGQQLKGLEAGHPGG